MKAGSALKMVQSWTIQIFATEFTERSEVKVAFSAFSFSYFAFAQYKPVARVYGLARYRLTDCGLAGSEISRISRPLSPTR